ncbi:hypothetical protein MPER_11678 [Moniliophthora perniciosa FA553]|nr:hypothetical protein MPER_11678 [Moniliophthora perniciosa FA553]
MLDLDTSSLSSLEDEAESDILSCGQTVGSIEVDRASDAQSDLDVRYVIPSTNGVRRVTKATVSPLDNASTERNVDTVRQLRSARKVVLDKPPGRTVGVSKSGGTSKTIISSSESRKPAEKRGKAKTTASLSKSLKSVGKSGKIKTTVSSSESLKPTERTGKTKNNKDVGLIGEGSQTYGNYEVENILDHEYRRGCIHYLLEFKGYEKSTAYWYKAVDLRHVVQIR